MADLHVRFTDHARERAQSHDVDLDEALSVVRDPDQVVTVREFRQSTSADGRSLFRVLVELTPSETVVVTMYKTTKIDKYWAR